MSTNKVQPMVITDPDTGREYTLEFNRKSVVKTEAAGLNINELESKSMTMVPLLFWGAFLMHHPGMTKEQSDKILFEGLEGLREEEMKRLGELYVATFQTLVSDEEAAKANPRKMAVKL